MAEQAAQARLALTTAADKSEAERLARTLLDERLIACATLLPGAESIYRWQGAAEQAAETVLLMKTDAAHVAALEARLLALHSYQTPEFLVLAVESGSAAYLDWLRASLGGA